MLLVRYKISISINKGGKKMKLSEIPKEELELMGYDDLAFLILQDENKKIKINELFKKVCTILNLSDQEFENRIADFFEILTTDKRFTMLEDGYWDLKDKHSEKVIIDEDEDFMEETEEEEEIEEEENIFKEEEEDSSTDEDLKDLVVIDGDEEEENL